MSLYQTRSLSFMKCRRKRLNARIILMRFLQEKKSGKAPVVAESTVSPTQHAHLFPQPARPSCTDRDRPRDRTGGPSACSPPEPGPRPRPSGALSGPEHKGRDMQEHMLLAPQATGHELAQFRHILPGLARHLESAQRNFQGLKVQTFLAVPASMRSTRISASSAPMRLRQRKRPLARLQA